MSTSSPELNLLLSHMDVSSRPREQGGSETITSSGPGSLVDAPPTEVSAILNDGTSHSSSMLGVRTVFEDATGGDSPMEDTDAVTLFPESVAPLGGHSQPKRYPVYRMPTSLDSFMSICRACIGRSRTFCLVKHCTTNHQGGPVAVKPGDLVVAKASGRIAFENPRISSAQLDDLVIGDWITSQETLTTWSNKFGQARESVEVGQKVDMKALKVKIEDEKKAAYFKTPRAKRGTMASKTTPLGIGISAYSKILRGQESFEDLGDDKFNEKMIEVIVRLDGALEELSAYSVMLGQDVERMLSSSEVTHHMIESKLQVLNRMVGGVPEDVASDLNSPMVWGALTALNCKIEEIRTSANKFAAGIPGKIDPKVELRLARSEAGVTKIEADLLATVTHLSKAITGMGSRVELIKARPSQTFPSTLSQPSAMTDVHDKLNKLSAHIAKLKGDQKTTNIKFGGLGFDSAQSAYSWFSLHMSGMEVGLIVDPHTVLEHIFNENCDQDFFKRFESIHKLKILTLQQGYAMTSFERSVPKYFSNGTQRVVKDHASYFDRISTWDDWDHPDTGHRATLIESLKNFKVAHRETLDTELTGLPIAYTIAILSLNDSVSIIEAWIAFIDEYVKGLTVAKFNFKKAFHVTSMLAKRLIMAIFEPRQGVLKTFKAGHMDQIGKAIFWATLRSLDIALEMKRVGFSNHPLVAAELVRFLTVNSGVEVTEQLERRISVLETNLAKAKKDVESAAKAAATASNKADKAEKAMEALVKRVTKLE